MGFGNKIIASIGGLMTVITAYSQDSIDIQTNFNRAYEEIVDMLDGKRPLSLKRSVFLVENAYFNNKLNYNIYCDRISFYRQLTIAYTKTNHLKGYHFSDSVQETINAALFRVFTDTIHNNNDHVASLPFRYNFQDALGEKEHSNIFVTTLLQTHQGNCRSLPYLYRILTEELGTKSYLALAPMHMYIKQRNKNIGWYNVELTSGQYPKDAYLIATGYISRQNIVSGLYMDTLSIKESIALCLMDLSHAYKIRMGNRTDLKFLLKCAETALAVKPNLIDALLVKQKVCKILWWKAEDASDTKTAVFRKLQYDAINQTLINMDYRDVSKETFEKWYNSYQTNQSRYTNLEINTSFKKTK